MTYICNLSDFSDDITLGYNQFKKLPPTREATHNTINISYLDYFQDLFTPIFIISYLSQ